ncbi:MAG: response regulator [Planctomycetota bacterium]|nr:response regulator [Planctomycetota bacterium]
MGQQDSILIVDDDPDMVSGLRRVLSLDNYQVETAGSIAEMLNRSDWSHFLAILLDRKLPDGYAEDVLPQLIAVAPDSAVIIVTGYADLDSTIAALRNGASDYLLKPVNPNAMRACLARLSQLKQAERRAVQAERLAAVGDLVAVLAHEARNYLQRIQTHVELLRFELRDQPEAIRNLGRIVESNDARAWHAESTEAVLAAWNTPERGLSVDEAARRQQAYGPNVLSEKGPSPLRRIVLRQFASPLIYILVASARGGLSMAKSNCRHNETITPLPENLLSLVFDPPKGRI